MPIYYDPNTGEYYRMYPGQPTQKLKMQTNVDVSQNPGTAGGPPPGQPPAPPPAGGAGGAAGTGGGGTVNAAGGNISQGNIYGGNVSNAAMGGSGTLDASGGDNNVYRETTQAPAAGGPAAGDPAGGPDTGGGGGGGKPCQFTLDCGGGPGDFACVNGTCMANTCPPGQVLDGQGNCFDPPNEDRSAKGMTSAPPSFTDFLKTKGA